MQENVMVISESLVRKHLTPEDAIRCVEETWLEYGRGEVIMPSKITLDMANAGIKGWYNSMPSYIRQTDLAGIKWVGGFEDNPKHGMPFIRAKVLLSDPRTGSLRALVAGDYISDLRTGAQPAIAAKYLAASTDVVTIIGAGNQGYHSLLCMSKILDLKEVRICDLNPAAREQFISRFPDANFKLVSCEDNQTACLGSDIIITVTTANAPLVQESWVKKGALVMTMGSYTEVSEELMRCSDKLVTDHIGQALHRGGFAEMAAKGEITAQSFCAELPDIIAGTKSGRTSSDERILAALIGIGAHDAACAALICRRLEEIGEAVPTVDMA